MSSTGCRIGKVTPKNKTILGVVKNTDAVRRINLGWGEVTIRCYDGKPITNETVCYVADIVKHVTMFGNS